MRGGEDDDCDIPARRDRMVDRKAATLQRKVARLFPHLQARPAFGWEDIDWEPKIFIADADGRELFSIHLEVKVTFTLAVTYDSCAQYDGCR